ncbi:MULTISPECIES: excinuclease ABC subunit UvrC [Holospora]|uniref:UvrABC system protein C n=2 Tax=Holospora TaxID=44747 RepID=A0A061JGI5_9PROT|nr:MULTISPECIES: excinuclease ABC subunit UvrC [Holospora]ETZ05196.1 uvrABC system protein C [Holospora undulata HU1]GAJ46655.1 uvrABC system protein C [Holospora elegans E1]
MYEEGVKALTQALSCIPDLPGVYEMLDAKGSVLYVGKAKRLARRVISYTRISALPLRLQQMVSKIRSVRYTVTHNELEALLLELHTIQKKKPPFNILLKEGHALWYLALSIHDFPALLAKRSNFLEGEKVFGPFWNRDILETTKTYIYKAFQLRSCSDHVFLRRKRPCLQYYIKSCSAPCVQKITIQEYKKTVEGALQILKGKSDKLEKTLLEEMKTASAHYAYEKAATLRDRLRWIHQAKTLQSFGHVPKEDLDVIAAAFDHGVTCLQVCCFRQGINYGGQHFFFPGTTQAETGQVLSEFIRQFYFNVKPPKEFLVSHPCSFDVIEALEYLHQVNVKLTTIPCNEAYQNVLSHANLNAQHALLQYVQAKDEIFVLSQRMKTVFQLTKAPVHIEVYDNSHVQGHYSCAGMVSFENGVWQAKNSRILFMGKTLGDDHALLREMLVRRFSKNISAPDLILVDGGAGQVSTAYDALCMLNLHHIDLLGIAKGPQHRDGKEIFYRKNQEPIRLLETDSLLHFLQRLRNKAHQYVIQAYRRKHREAMVQGLFEQIPGVGPARQEKLRCIFPDAEALKSASLEDLKAVPGFSKKLAEKVYEFLQSF